MRKMTGIVSGIVVFCGMLFAGTLCFAQAYDQLQDTWNTGVTFDGSDGERSGMDTYVSQGGYNIPDVPEPTPVYDSYQAPEPVYDDDYSEPEPEPELESEPEPVRSGYYDAD